MTLPDYPALVLNADFTPVRIHPLSTWGFERVMRNVLKNRVTVLEEHDAVLRSPTMEYRPPSVVALKRYVRMPKGAVFNRMNIFLRDDFQCQYCGGRFLARDLTFDHVIPWSKGGGTNYENIVSACAGCNSRKGDRHMEPLRRPKSPTQRELARRIPRERLIRIETWLDYLYWSGVLKQD